MQMDKTVCFCHDVTIQQISDAIDKGAKNLEEVQQATGAGTGCGGCVDHLTNVVEELLKKQFYHIKIPF